MLSLLVLHGVLITYKSGEEIGRERWRDDGNVLTSEIELIGQRGTVALSRKPPRVTVTAGGRTITRDVPPGTVVLENGAWQEYALAAEGRPSGADARPVKVMVPAQGAIVDGSLRIVAGAAGRRELTLSLGPVEVKVELSPKGEVLRATIPSQGLEALPEGVAPTVAKARPAPPGVVERPLEVKRDGATLRGVLWRPAKAHGTPPLAFLIAGSGPTDRDGNSTLGVRTDMYRQLAEALVARGVAVARFDKRGVGASTLGPHPEAYTMAEGIADAAALLDAARATGDVGAVVLVGHSEGALLATLLAAGRDLAGLVLVSGPGRPLAQVLHEQLARQLTDAQLADAEALLGDLRAGRPLDEHRADRLPSTIRLLFAPSARTYLASQLDVDPAAALAKLPAKLPVVVVQGMTDIQVSVADAQRLAEHHAADLVLLPHVNHVLKVEPSTKGVQASYQDPSRPLAPLVVDAVMRAVPK